MRENVRNITFEENDLGYELNTIRRNLSELEFTQRITVLALQQGVGKTHTFLEYAKSNYQNMKIIYASPRHDQLIENMNTLGQHRARHWYGFSYYDGFTYKGCPRLNENVPLLNALKEENEFKSLLNPTFICPILGCNQNRCRYHINHRRIDNKIDLIPTSYLGTDLILSQHPDIIFIDESIEDINQYKYDEILIDSCINIIELFSPNNTLIEKLLTLKVAKSDNNIEYLTNALFNEILEARNNLIVDLLRTNEEEHSLEYAFELNKLDSIIRYFQNTSDLNVDVFYKPRIYNVFDLCLNHDVKIVFLNASFNKNLFEYYLRTYPNGVGDITIPLYSCEIINPKSTLIRVYPNNKFWKGAFQRRSLARTKREITNVIRHVEKHFSKEDIGIITYQKSGEGESKVNVEYLFRQEGYDTIHFWAQSGLNLLENKSVLFIIGTPTLKTEDIIKKWEEIHNEESGLTQEEIGGSNLGWTINENGEFGRVGNRGYQSMDVYIKPIGEPGAVGNDFKEYDFSLIKDTSIKQIIDSIHRCRALTHNRIIIALGDVPKRELMMILDDENAIFFTDDINYMLGIEQLEINELDELDRIIKDSDTFHNNKKKKLMNFVIDNQNYMSRREIARALHLWNENHNPNVRLIRDIEEIISRL